MSMKNFWIIVGIIVLIGILYFGGKELFTTSNPEASPTADTLSGLESATPESTGAPTIAATESPVINPSPSESLSASPVASGPTTTSVSLVNMSFQPASVTVKVGDTVMFTNNDTVPHNVTFASFSSKLMQPGDLFSHTFRTKGTYNYKCTIHPKVMTGVVVVQ